MEDAATAHEAEADDPEFSLWVTAHHEAAHAVAYRQQDVPFRYVTIRPRPKGSAAGKVVVRLGQPVRHSSMSFIAAAGPIAEARCTFAELDDAALTRVFAELDDQDDGGDLHAYVRAMTGQGIPCTMWVGIWREHERFLTTSLWTAVEAVAAALLGSPRGLTRAEVDDIMTSAGG